MNIRDQSDSRFTDTLTVTVRCPTVPTSLNQCDAPVAPYAQWHGETKSLRAAFTVTSAVTCEHHCRYCCVRIMSHTELLLFELWRWVTAMSFRRYEVHMSLESHELPESPFSLTAVPAVLCLAVPGGASQSCNQRVYPRASLLCPPTLGPWKHAHQTSPNVASLLSPLFKSPPCVLCKK